MTEKPNLTLNKEEMDALTKDLQAVLIKHNADMGVQATITLMRSPEIPTPYASTGEESEKEEGNQTNTEAGSGSESNSSEPPQS